MATPDLDLTPTEETTYCAVHPDRETGLRCNKCGRYMCVHCAVRTPVGYRCKECVRGIEDKFFQATQYDYIIIAAVCAVLGGIGGAIVKAIGIPLLFMLILGLPIGGGIAGSSARPSMLTSPSATLTISSWRSYHLRHVATTPTMRRRSIPCSVS